MRPDNKMVWQWKKLTVKLPEVRMDHCSYVIDNKVFLFLGFNTKTFKPSKRLDVFDLSTRTWIATKKEEFRKSPMCLLATAFR